MAIKTDILLGSGSTETSTLDDVTTRGATTTNAITVGGVTVGTEYSLPTLDGSENQVLKTDGNGSLSFTTINVTGGLQYIGTFNATTGLPSLANAEKGDYYKISTGGTIYGQTWDKNDSLLINEDMGGSITNSKIDKIDNTEPTNVLITTNNLSDLDNASTARTNLGLGTAATSASTDFLQVSNNLSDLNNVATARTNLGLGTAATVDTGTDIGDVVVLQDVGSVAKLPAVDGSLLTNISATDSTKLAIANNLSDLNNVATARTNLGLGSAATSASTDFLQVSNNLSDLNNASTARTNLGVAIGSDVQAYDAQLTDIASLATTDSGFIVGNGSTFVLESGATVRTSLGLGTAATEDHGTATGDLVILEDVSGVAGLPAVDGSQLINITATSSDTLDDVTTRGATTTNAINVGTITTSGDILADADASRTIGAEATRFITYHGDMNGAIRFKAKNNQGSAITKGQAVYISGVSGTVPEVKLAQANSALTMPAFGLALANANDQAEVQVITFGNLTDYNTTTYSLSANDTVYISATTAGALTNSAPSGESNLIQNIGRVVRADASAGIIKVGGAGRSNATPNLDQDKIFLGNASNQSVSTALSSIALSSFNDDLSYLSSGDNVSVLTNDAGYLTGITGESIGDLSDVTVTSAANGEVLSYNGTNWVNSAASAGSLSGLSDVTITSAASGEVLKYNGTAWVDAQLAYSELSGTPTNVSTFTNDANYVASGDNVSVLTNDANYVASGDNVSVLTNDAGYLTGITGESLNDLSDVSFTAGVGIDNYVLTYDHSTTSWGAESAPGVYTYSAITADPSSAQYSYHYSCTGTFTLTLPASASGDAGKEIRIKNMGTGTITVDGNASETIDGQTTIDLDTQYSSITLIATGNTPAAWEIV